MSLIDIETFARRLSRRKFLGWAGGAITAVTTAYIGLRHADRAFAEDKVTCCIYECFRTDHTSFLVPECLQDTKDGPQQCPRAKDIKIQGRTYSCSIWAAPFRCQNCGKCRLDTLKRCCRYSGERCGTTEICVSIGTPCPDPPADCIGNPYNVVCDCAHCPP